MTLFYLRELKSIRYQPNAISHPISEARRVFWISEGLGDSYKFFKVTMLRAPLLTYAKVMLQLEIHELQNEQSLFAALGAFMTSVSHHQKGGHHGKSYGNAYEFFFKGIHPSKPYIGLL